jgi:hypothetical protein
MVTHQPTSAHELIEFHKDEKPLTISGNDGESTLTSTAAIDPIGRTFRPRGAQILNPWR